MSVPHRQIAIMKMAMQESGIRAELAQKLYDVPVIDILKAMIANDFLKLGRPGVYHTTEKGREIVMEDIGLPKGQAQIRDSQ